MLVLIALFVGILALLYDVFAWSIVSWNFYNWFILESFDNLPNISYFQFIGISLFVGTIIRYRRGMKETDKKNFDLEKIKMDIMVFLLSPWVALLFGSIIRWIWF